MLGARRYPKNCRRPCENPDAPVVFRAKGTCTLPVTLLFLHPLAEMLKCCFCGSKGASMTDFHDLQLKEQLLLQQKWEDDVDVDEGNVYDLCVRFVKPNKFFDKTPLAAHRDESGQRDDSSSSQVQQVKPGKPVKPEPKNKARRTVKTVRVDDCVAKFGKYGLYNGNGVLMCRCCGKRVDHNREDIINSHIMSQTHDKCCAAHIAEGAPYVLAPVTTNGNNATLRRKQKKRSVAKNENGMSMWLRSGMRSAASNV